MKTNSIHLGQIQVEAGRPDINMQNAISRMKQVPTGGIIVFPEMFISGYMIGDDFLRDSFIKDCRAKNDVIVELSKKLDITIVWGNIDIDESKKNEDGSVRKYNTAYIASRGKLLKKQYKTLLPNYRMFDDKRYFTSLKTLAEEEGIDISKYYEPVEVVIDGVKTKVSLLICEDIWNINGDYNLDPVAMTKTHMPDLIVVPSCSPFGLEKAKFRDRLLQIQSQNTSLAYVNPIGIQNNGKNIFNFDGGSAFYQNGSFVKGVKNYGTEEVSELVHELEIEQIYEALINSVKEFWKQSDMKKAIIGLSGGIDSGVNAALLTIALGKENVTAINMPSRFNSNTTKNLAEKLANNLGINYLVSPIQDAVDLTIKMIEMTTGIPPSSFEIENIQARERGKMLSDLAPRFQAFYTNNGNKDEIMTGYATLYGDVNGSIALIGDLTKEQVKALARYINKKNGKEIISNEMIDMKPTAELSDSQSPDNGGGDPFNYRFLGAVNKAFIEKQKSLIDLVNALKNGNLEQVLGLHNGELERNFNSKKVIVEELEKIWRLKNNNIFKRIQAPPIPTISKRSFGFDFREAQKKVYFGEGYEELKEEVICS
nr:NAD(+) synthase [Candidatus Gracilibacteria bacterium]